MRQSRRLPGTSPGDDKQRIHSMRRCDTLLLVKIRQQPILDGNFLNRAFSRIGQAIHEFVRRDYQARFEGPES